MNTIEASLCSRAHSGLINKFFAHLVLINPSFLNKLSFKTSKVVLIAGMDYLSIECYRKITLENLI
jgi:hypothetical protein